MIRRTRPEGSSFLRWTLAFSALASIAACGAEAPEWLSGDMGEGIAAQAPEFMPGTLRSSKRMPDELRAAYIRAVQEDAPEEYAAERVLSDGFYLKNSGQSFDGTIDRNGVALAPRDASWSFSLRTTEVGCEGAMVSLAEPAVDADKNRVRYVRPDIEEWYLNGPLGLEQGFVIDEPFACEGTKVIRMETAGDLHAELNDQDGDGKGESIRYVRPSGTTTISVADLYVTDAEGRRIPAWMTVKTGSMAIHFDDTDATYPVNVDPLLAVLEAKILNPSSSGTNDEFGYGLSLAGDLALIGAPKATVNGQTNAGRAYVFRRVSPGDWQPQGVPLVPSDTKAWQWFGFSVALSGNTAVLTAPYDGNPIMPPNPNAPPTDQRGAAYVFIFNGANWVQEAILKPADNKYGDVFGVSAAISGDQIVVGAHGCDTTPGIGNEGAAYVFRRTGGIWTQQQKLIASDGEPYELFGTTVTISPAAIGAASVWDDDQGQKSGSMYMFRWNGASWVEHQKILAPGGNAADIFGYWAAMSGDTMVVTAALYDDGVTDSNFGAGFVYVNDGANWSLQQKLAAPDRKVGDWFGSHVAIDGNSIVVGAQQTDEKGVDSGAAYWFIRNGSTWTMRDKMLPIPGASGDRFGWTVGVSGSLAAIGAPFDDDKASNAGAVYIFNERKTNGEPCTIGTECVSGICVDGVCCDTVCGNGNPNDCQACSIANGGPVDGTCSPFTAGTTCRAAGGVCDVTEACDGVNIECPPDRKVGTGTDCRPSLGACDIAEKCDGMTNNCPADTTAPAGTECRPSAGGCDIAEQCNGASPACPPDVIVAAGTTCRAAAGACDTVEVCNGVDGVCPPDGKVAAGVECRGSVGDCDATEVCDGATNECPVDRKVPADTTCRASAGACDNPEKCDGMTNECPVDTKLAMGTLCRASIGDCDLPETCDGTSNACPLDGKSPAGVLCRPSDGICDPAETCNGTSDTCPPDTKSSPDVVCRAPAGFCDLPEFCDGTTSVCPEDIKRPATQLCRPPKGLCDEVEFCDGASDDCPFDQKTAAGVFCRAPKGLCDEPEACDGVNDACPADEVTPPDIVCRPSKGSCDIEEVCNGVSMQCPSDKLMPPTEVCREAQGTCDIAESCDGQTPDCPEDLKVGENIPCRASSGECGAEEVCDGKSVDCPKDGDAPNGQICSIGQCIDGDCTPRQPLVPEEYTLYGGGPICQTGPIGSSSSTPWPLAFLAVALGSLRRRVRPSKH